MPSEERKEIPLPKDFSEWSVEKQQGFFKGYRYGRKRQEEDPDSMPADLEEAYPYNFLRRVYKNNQDMAFMISPAEFETFCYEELDDKENAVLLFVYEEGVSYEATGNLLNMTRERIRQTEAKIVRKVKNRFPESVQSTVNDPEQNPVPDRKEQVSHNDLNGLTLADLDLSTRAMTILKRADIRTLNDLINTTEEDFYHVRGCGMTTINEIRNKLAEHGLSLKEIPF